MNRRTRKFILWVIAALIVLGLGFTVKQDVKFNKGNQENYALTHEDQAQKNGIIVFCYHRVLKDTVSVRVSRFLSNNSQLHDFEVPLTNFREQMTYLHQHHVKVLSIEQMSQMVKSGKPIRGKYVVLTFDDIDRSTIDNAIPIMKKYQMPFTTFIITGDTGRYREGTQLATWQQVKDAKKSAGSLMTVGLHTNDMHYLTKNFKPIFDLPKEYPRFKQDFATSRTRLQQEMHIKGDVFAYPYGGGPKRVSDFLKRQHLNAVATLDVGIVNDQTDLNQVPRVIVNQQSWPSIADWLKK